MSSLFPWFTGACFFSSVSFTTFWKIFLPDLFSQVGAINDNFCLLLLRDSLLIFIFSKRPGGADERGKKDGFLAPEFFSSSDVKHSEKYKRRSLEPAFRWRMLFLIKKEWSRKHFGIARPSAPLGNKRRRAWERFIPRSSCQRLSGSSCQRYPRRRG